VDCPNCGLINLPEALRCDCGYSFATKSRDPLLSNKGGAKLTRPTWDEAYEASLGAATRRRAKLGERTSGKVPGIWSLLQKTVLLLTLPPVVATGGVFVSDRVLHWFGWSPVLLEFALPMFLVIFAIAITASDINRWLACLTALISAVLLWYLWSAFGWFAVQTEIEINNVRGALGGQRMVIAIAYAIGAPIVAWYSSRDSTMG